MKINYGYLTEEHSAMSRQGNETSICCIVCIRGQWLSWSSVCCTELLLGPYSTTSTIWSHGLCYSSAVEFHRKHVSFSVCPFTSVHNYVLCADCKTSKKCSEIPSEGRNNLQKKFISSPVTEIYFCISSII